MKNQPSKKPVKADPKHPLMLNGKDWDRQKVMNFLCGRIAGEEKSLRTLLSEGFEGHRLPSAESILTWIGEDNGLSDQYARAKDAQGSLMAEKTVEIADEPVKDAVEAARNRLRVDARKWLASKLAPKKYGDKLQLGGADDLPPVKHDVTLSPEDAYLRMLGKGNK